MLPVSRKNSGPAASAPVGRPTGDAGFTMVEVLVASTLLIIGMFASLAMLDRSSAATGSTSQRDVANALTQEIVERAQGMRYTNDLNDLTDIRTGALATPADRMRAAIDPGVQSGSSTVTVLPTPTARFVKDSQWTLRRNSTTYTITLAACTQSDTIGKVLVQGPYDCDRPPDPPTPPPKTPASETCPLGLLSLPTDITPENISSGTLTVRAQVLGLNLSLCLPSLLDALPLNLTSSLCSLLGGSATSVISQVTSALNGLLSSAGLGLGIGLCSAGSSTPEIALAAAGIAASTEVETSVSWRDQASGKTQTVVQTALIRKPTS
ncbi:hypothetical protein AB0L40_02380 [Patulibacter sp. NPDC049589]|uniref:type IV pilus modification PilV family protein n=1 Tax=Patulibacter sp. NPDC049589 TaxID=3154731 RepID=UPI003416D8B1